MQESAKKRGCPEDSLRFFRSKKRGRRRRGQGTVEFIILFSAALFFFVIFMGVIQINIFSNNVDKQKVFLQNICLNVRDEISFAAESSEGYYREFYVPQNALGIEYDINITDQFVFCFFQTYHFVQLILETFVALNYNYSQSKKVKQDHMEFRLRVDSHLNLGA